jgi:hypothetical protein
MRSRFAAKLHRAATVLVPLTPVILTVLAMGKRW